MPSEPLVIPEHRGELLIGPDDLVNFDVVRVAVQDWAATVEPGSVPRSPAKQRIGKQRQQCRSRIAEERLRNDIAREGITHETGDPSESR